MFRKHPSIQIVNFDVTFLQNIGFRYPLTPAFLYSFSGFFRFRFSWEGSHSDSKAKEDFKRMETVHRKRFRQAKQKNWKWPRSGSFHIISLKSLHVEGAILYRFESSSRNVHQIYSLKSEMIWGTLAQKGEANYKKTGVLELNLKPQIFSAECAIFFWKIKHFKPKLTVFVVFREYLSKFQLM